MTRSLVRSNPSELRLMDLENMLRMIDHLALTRDGIQHSTRDTLDKRRVPDADRGNGARIENNQLTGSDQFECGG